MTDVFPVPVGAKCDLEFIAHKLSECCDSPATIVPGENIVICKPCPVSEKTVEVEIATVGGYKSSSTTTSATASTPPALVCCARRGSKKLRLKVLSYLLNAMITVSAPLLLPIPRAVDRHHFTVRLKTNCNKAKI